MSERAGLMRWGTVGLAAHPSRLPRSLLHALVTCARPASFRYAEATGLGYDWRSTWSDIDVPVLAGYGARDRLVTSRDARALLEAIPGRARSSYPNRHTCPRSSSPTGGTPSCPGTGPPPERPRAQTPPGVREYSPGNLAPSEAPWPAPRTRPQYALSEQPRALGSSSASMASAGPLRSRCSRAPMSSRSPATPGVASSVPSTEWAPRCRRSQEGSSRATTGGSTPRAASSRASG